MARALYEWFLDRAVETAHAAAAAASRELRRMPNGPSRAGIDNWLHTVRYAEKLRALDFDLGLGDSAVAGPPAAPDARALVKREWAKVDVDLRQLAMVREKYRGVVHAAIARNLAAAALAELSAAAAEVHRVSLQLNLTEGQPAEGLHERLEAATARYTSTLWVLTDRQEGSQGNTRTPLWKAWQKTEKTEEILNKWEQHLRDLASVGP